MRPVTMGAATPAKFPAQFCRPVHLPAPCGPASVCVMHQLFELVRPKENDATTSKLIANIGFCAIAESIKNRAHDNTPVITNVFRTNVVFPPRAIQRSETEPPNKAPAATAQNGREPAKAMVSVL